MLIFPCSYPTPGIVNAKTGEVIVADCYDNVRLPSLHLNALDMPMPSTFELQATGRKEAELTCCR